jgi:hypothetical protein
LCEVQRCRQELADVAVRDVAQADAGAVHDVFVAVASQHSPGGDETLELVRYSSHGDTSVISGDLHLVSSCSGDGGSSL